MTLEQRRLQLLNLVDKVPEKQMDEYQDLFDWIVNSQKDYGPLRVLNSYNLDIEQFLLKTTSYLNRIDTFMLKLKK